MIITVLCFLVIPLLLIESYSEEIADRDGVDDLKREKITVNDKINSLEIDIEKQKTIIEENQTEYDNLKIELKTIRKNSNDSWTDIKKIIDAQKKLTESNNEITTSKDKFQSLLTEKSDNIKLIDELDEKIDDLII